MLLLPLLRQLPCHFFHTSQHLYDSPRIIQSQSSPTSQSSLHTHTRSFLLLPPHPIMLQLRDPPATPHSSPWPSHIHPTRYPFTTNLDLSSEILSSPAPPPIPHLLSPQLLLWPSSITQCPLCFSLVPTRALPSFPYHLSPTRALPSSQYLLSLTLLIYPDNTNSHTQSIHILPWDSNILIMPYTHTIYK